MRLYRHLLFLTLALPCASVSAATHCDTNEIVYFSCAIAESKKVVSLCGATEAEDPKIPSWPKVAWLQYRYGYVGNPEMVFPKEKSTSLSKFIGYWTFSKMGQFGIDEVSFDNNGFTYAINQTESDTPDEIRTFKGVTVTKDNKEIARLSCRGKVISRLRDAVEAVPARQ